MKQHQTGSTTIIDLNKLRDMGFIVNVTEGGAHEHGELHIIARKTMQGPVLREEIAANLDMTIGAKRALKVENKAIDLINRAFVQDALKLATR